MRIKDIVHRLIKKYNTDNPFRIANEMGIIIITLPLGKKTRGFYQYRQRNHIIYLNENLEEYERKQVIAHELGHACMHRGVNSIFLDTRTFLKTSIYETEANTFASLLLINDLELQECFDNNLTIDNIATKYGISKELIELRLKEYKN